MPRSPTRPPLPIAGEPICSALEALRVFSLAVHHPLEAETIAFFLDASSCSNTITVVSGTTEPDSIVSVAECMALAASRSPSLCGVVLATIRPNSPVMLPGDLDRWLLIDAITEAQGIELVEWFIIGPGAVECPRQVLGEPDRW
ncbi:MAG: hypothetical protein ACXV3B_08035 [Ilumatobacteraceae bacterium]